VLASAIVGSSLAFIDGTVVTVALPAMGREFGAGGADLQWVIEIYALFLSALLLVGGALGDRYGRRRLFGLGIGLFTLASIGCGAAASLPVLLAARALQGVGGALLVPGSLALLSASFEPSARGRAIGTWSGWSGVTTAIGPLVGGWLVGHSWRLAFWLNVPLAAVVLWLLRGVPESRNAEARRIDIPGACLATAGLGGLVYGLIESSRRGWSDPGVWGGLAGGTLALGAFLGVEARSPSPLLPLRLFRSATFSAANGLTFFLYGALSSVFFFLPLDLVQVQGATPLAAGAALLPFIATLFVLSRWSGGLVSRVGARLPLVTGPLVAGAGFLLLSRPGIGGSYWTTFFPGVLVLGLGMATTIAPLTTTVMNAVDLDNAGVASGVNNAVSRAAGLVGIAVLGILLVHMFDTRLQEQLQALEIDPAVQRAVWEGRGKLAAAQPPADVAPETAASVRAVIGDAFVQGFRAVCRASAAGSVLAAACAALWIRGGRAGTAPSTPSG
jgi:EmrB/QacA subfamily drug resistance transporter